jgi:hypothetical protein
MACCASRMVHSMFLFQVKKPEELKGEASRQSSRRTGVSASEGWRLPLIKQEADQATIGFRKGINTHRPYPHVRNSLPIT